MTRYVSMKQNLLSPSDRCPDTGVSSRIGKDKRLLSPAVGISRYVLDRGLPAEPPLSSNDRKGDLSTW